jgi:hypothetical protein
MGVEADPNFTAINSNSTILQLGVLSSQQIEIDDPELGQLRVRVWHNYHFRLSPSHSMSVVLVERLTTDGYAKTNKPMWRGICGIKNAPTRASGGGSIYDDLRSTIGIAQAKNRLHWTVPRLSTPPQCDRWSDLMPIVTWQLWLARHLVEQRPLLQAKSSDQTYPWTSCPIMREYFSPVRYTGPASQTAR